MLGRIHRIGISGSAVGINGSSPSEAAFGSFSLNVVGPPEIPFHPLTSPPRTHTDGEAVLASPLTQLREMEEPICPLKEEGIKSIWYCYQGTTSPQI